MSNRKNGGQAIVDAFKTENIEMLFGIPGAGELPIFNELYDEHELSFISTYFENSAALMAETHGRLLGNPGICINIAGPGSTNTVTGIAQAYANSSPVVHITGDFGLDDKILSYHGVDDYDFTLKLFEPITKWSVRIKRSEDIPAILSKAFSIAKSGRPGPVHVQIPPHVTSSEFDYKGYQKSVVVRNGAPDYLINEAIELIKEAHLPTIYAGLGVERSFAFNEIIKLAELIGAPIGTTRPASAVVPYDHPLCIGNPHHLIPSIPNVCTEIMENSDLVITVGTGLGGASTKSLKKIKNIIHIDYGEKLDYHRVTSLSDYNPRKKLFGDIKTILKQVIGKLGEKKTEVRNIKQKINALKKKRDNQLNTISDTVTQPLHPYAVISELRKELNEEAILCADVGSSCRWVSRYKNYKPNTLLISGRWDSMGSGLATSIAAKALNPDKQVVDLTGDGGFLMAPMELGTAVKYNLNIVIVILRNDVLGSIWRHQQRLFPGRTYATELFCPNFVEYAESFGAKGIAVNDRKELKDALNVALSSDGPVIIEVPTQHKWKAYDFSGTPHGLH